MNIINNYNLSQQYTMLLHQCVSQHFNIGKYQSLDDILTKLRVDVIIEPGIVHRVIPIELKAARDYWQEEAIRLESMTPKAVDKETAMENYHKARKNLGDVQKEMEVWTSMPLRGLYNDKLNVIKLYPDEMQQEDNGNCMDGLLVSTLAHETMHAYFNRRKDNSYPYVIHVEEPLAEFGMLLYLYETSSKYYNWAYQDVSSKKTCYRYGAQLMDQHLIGDSSVQKNLEKYRIKLNGYPMPTVNPTGRQIVMPIKGGRSASPVRIGGQTIYTSWQYIFKHQPRYFYDQNTNTLALDGDWSRGSIHSGSIDIDILIHMHIHNINLKQIYLGDNFSIDHHHQLDELLSMYNVIVSPSNKLFYAQYGVPFYKNNNTPVLQECGDELYKLYRNDKWGVVDTQLNLVVPFNYDSLWSFDQNDLIMVRIYDGHNHHYGLVNKLGQEQVTVIYDDISKNNDDTYTVKQNGSEFKINKNGNKI